ncbi:MAG: hypothetical protein JXB20_04435 [Bacilli bacterium]|nr:hypothetical protein [Bacilli bacterium]MBN2696295.1 hypothetical protein [Bacilli bacterium]
MTQFICGLLHGVDESKRVLAIKTKHRVRFFYMAKSIFSTFMNYFGPGIYVFMTVTKESRTYKGYRVQNVINVDKVMEPNRQKPKLFYDLSIIRSGIRTIVNTDKPKLFLDLEMSMPPYRNYQTFVSEVIQAGMVLSDDQDKLLIEHAFFIKPKLFPDISERTRKFLKIQQNEVDAGKDYHEFHRIFMDILRKYRPTIYVWGKNDKLELKKMNSIHQLEDFTVKAQFVDLLQLHKIYFNLKNDLGLFAAYNMYSTEALDQQRHDAFQDASITRNVFFWFREVANGRLAVELGKDLSDKKENENENKS